MAVVTLDFETLTGGASLATAGVWAAAGFSVAPTIDGGGALVASTTAGQFFHGSVGLKFTGASTTVANHAYGTVNGLNCTDLAVDACFSWPALSVADFQQIRLYDTAAVSICTFILNSAGKFRITGPGGTITTWTAATPTGTWCRLKIWVQPGPSTTTGQITAAVYNAQTGAQIGSTLTLTNANLGTANIDQIRYGHTGGYLGDYYGDLFGYSVNQGGLMPDLGGNTPPTASITSGAIQNVSAAASVALTASDSDPGGSIASRAWTFLYPASGAPALTGGTTSAASFTAGPAGSLYIVQYVATDNLGATSTPVTCEIRVPSSTGEMNTLPAYPPRGVVAAVNGSAGNAGATLASGTVGSPVLTNYLQWPDTTAVQQEEAFRLEPMATQQSLVWSVCAKRVNAGAMVLRFRLYEGTTLRKEWVLADPTTTATTQTVTLSSTDAATIGDWGFLWVALAESST